MVIFHDDLSTLPFRLHFLSVQSGGTATLPPGNVNPGHQACKGEQKHKKHIVKITGREIHKYRNHTGHKKRYGYRSYVHTMTFTRIIRFFVIVRTQRDLLPALLYHTLI